MTRGDQMNPEEQVRSWGFKQVLTWTDTPNAHYPPHKHEGLTTHLITKGTMIVLLPEDENPTKQTYRAGSRIDIGANQMHEVWIGSDGCTSVIGE